MPPYLLDKVKLQNRTIESSSVRVAIPYILIIEYYHNILGLSYSPISVTNVTIQPAMLKHFARQRFSYRRILLISDMTQSSVLQSIRLHKYLELYIRIFVRPYGHSIHDIVLTPDLYYTRLPLVRISCFNLRVQPQPTLPSF